MFSNEQIGGIIRTALMGMFSFLAGAGLILDSDLQAAIIAGLGAILIGVWSWVSKRWTAQRVLNAPTLLQAKQEVAASAPDVASSKGVLAK